MSIEAVILKKIPIREYDELVVCYTRHAGKQTYQAKSVRRNTSKQAGHLDLLNWVDFTLVCPKRSSGDFAANGYPIITQAYSLRTFHNLKSSLPALAVSFFVLESFDKLIFEGQTDQELWDFLVNRLDEFDELAKHKGCKWPLIIESTRKELLKVLGHPMHTSIEDIANARFYSLQFAKKVIN